MSMTTLRQRISPRPAVFLKTFRKLAAFCNLFIIFFMSFLTPVYTVLLIVTFHAKNRIPKPVRPLIFGKNGYMKAEFVFQHASHKWRTFFFALRAAFTGA